MFGKLALNIFQALPKITCNLPARNLCMSSNTPNALLPAQTPGGLWSLTFFRTRMRYHFPRPNEVRRIKRHGWQARMSTPSGRKILMRRILKGKFVLSH
ncbi:39S ribosomal protein L34, mitochondrial [Cephus cinctus]|uniref:Large ribosomal subunit protein bL34m n=1 Tax=Cephus cinctus TaxID=211228 RepID=A0AAJ7C3T1_CEPCN|nr:39S ribosomal protein L34, mitochondrial [Cephus cinctus]